MTRNRIWKAIRTIGTLALVLAFTVTVIGCSQNTCEKCPSGGKCCSGDKAAQKDCPKTCPHASGQTAAPAPQPAAPEHK